MTTIFKTEIIFRQIMTDAINVYMKNYAVYAESYRNDQLILIIVIMVICGILLGLYIGLGYKKIY
jgi:hypothetical protein